MSSKKKQPLTVKSAASVVH